MPKYVYVTKAADNSLGHADTSMGDGSQENSHERCAGSSPGVSCSQHGPGNASLIRGDLENFVSFTVWLRSSLFFGGMVVSVLVFWPVLMAAWVLPIVQRMRVIRVWAWFINRWLGATCGLHYEVSGLENLPQQPGVILSKHQSAWETIVFQVIFPPQTWALKREALWIPFFGWGLAATDPIAINRSTRVRALDQLCEQGKIKLAEGRWVVIFPEGTRIPPGEQGRYFPGGAMLAVRAGVPVIPVAHNAGQYWGRRSFLKYPGTITVRIGPAIDTRNVKAREVNKAAAVWIEDTMQELYRNNPPSPTTP